MTRKELIDIIDHDITIDLDENGNFKHNALGRIWKGNKDPKCGKIDDFLVSLTVGNSIYKEFDNYDDLLDYKIKGKTIYDRLKNEDADDICTRILDDRDMGFVITAEDKKKYNL